MASHKLLFCLRPDRVGSSASAALRGVGDSALVAVLDAEYGWRGRRRCSDGVGGGDQRGDRWHRSVVANDGFSPATLDSWINSCGGGCGTVDVVGSATR